MHLHPETVPQEARHLRNQVICMIAEYHLTSSARGSSSLSLVLPEAAKPLLPPIKSYVSGIAFEGTWDVRVLDHAQTLRVAAWLHWLDMSTGGDGIASKTLGASWHSLGPLLESFLALTMSNLTFQEIVDRILHENLHDAQRSLHDLRARHTHIRQELDDLTQTHRESEKSSQKRIKKEIDIRRKDLESLKERISQYESHLGQDMLGDNPPMTTTCLAMVQKRRWLLPQEPMTLLQRVPRLKPPTPLQLKAMPWRWMKRVLSHLQLVLSPMRMMICYLAVTQLGLRLAWPT